MGTFSEYIAPARERHEAGRQAVNSGDYTGILDMLLAYPELAARAASGGIGELSGLVGQSPTMQRKLANDVMGMMESTAGMGMSMRMVPKAPARRSFSTVIIDDGRPTTHRVFQGGFNVGKSDSSLLANDPNLAYRITGNPQIQDMIESGLVRAKPPEVKMRGGKRSETQWSQGSDGLFYNEPVIVATESASPSVRLSQGETQWSQGAPWWPRKSWRDGDHFVVVTKADGLHQRSGGIPIDELEAVYSWQGRKPVNILEDIRRSNASISRRMMEGK